MKKTTLIQRLRESPAGRPGPLASAESRRPFRLWMTSSLAVVMAAMIPMRGIAGVTETKRSPGLRVLAHSRYGVGETTRRIERAVRDQGLSVLALLPGARSVLVLGSSEGGTPVVMDWQDSQPSVPLSLMVDESRSGGADVLMVAAASDAEAAAWRDLPAAVTQDLQRLPSLVERALR